MPELAPADPLTAQLLDTARSLGHPNLHPDTPLDAAGVDSLDRVALATTAETITGRPIPDDALTTARTLADFAAALTTRRPVAPEAAA